MRKNSPGSLTAVGASDFGSTCSFRIACYDRQSLPVCPFRPIGNDALRMKSKMENRYGETKGGKDAFSNSMVVPYQGEIPFHRQNADSTVRIRSCASSPSVVTKRPVLCEVTPTQDFLVYPNGDAVSRGLSWPLFVLDDEFRGGGKTIYPIAYPHLPINIKNLSL